ncbi:MAG: tetratricopeptide repeat protein [Candidatus Omnitrophica bacterium]|nr:tetratricopeptide repeat protein [Candidatus Omnitrophota bacterium]
MGKLKLIVLTLMILIVNHVLGYSESSESTADDEIQLQLLSDGRRLIADGKPAEAITGCFDRVIANFNSKYGDRKEQIYCARTPAERLMYLLIAANAKRAAIAISSVWADAHLMKGFALIELGRIPEAKSSIEQALTLSPNNPLYLSELGYIYQIEKNWAKSVELFQAAEDAAISFSPEEYKKFELGRARRSLGYAYIEMGQYDKAEEEYRKCIEEDPNDDKAREELEYIHQLKSKANS